jgi:hypothetical protein
MRQTSRATRPSPHRNRLIASKRMNSNLFAPQHPPARRKMRKINQTTAALLTFIIRRRSPIDKSCCTVSLRICTSCANRQFSLRKVDVTGSSPGTRPVPAQTAGLCLNLERVQFFAPTQLCILYTVSLMVTNCRHRLALSRQQLRLAKVRHRMAADCSQTQSQLALPSTPWKHNGFRQTT